MNNPTAGLVIFAKDHRRLTGFYAHVLSLETSEVAEDFARLESAAFELVVQKIPAAVAEQIVISDPPKLRDSTPLKPVFFVHGIEAARVRAQANGGIVYGVEQEWEFRGFKVCDGYDPEGNRFQLRARSS